VSLDKAEPGTMHAEKRSHPRYQFENQAIVTIELTSASGEKEERSFSCRTTDVSLRGVRLILDCSLPLNSTVQLKIKIGKHAHLFEHPGRIAWCRPDTERGMADAGCHSAGIEFTTRPGPMLDEWRNELFALLE